MVPMFECTKSYEIMSPKNYKFDDETTVGGSGGLGGCPPTSPKISVAAWGICAAPNLLQNSPKIFQLDPLLVWS